MLNMTYLMLMGRSVILYFPGIKLVYSDSGNLDY